MIDPDQTSRCICMDGFVFDGEACVAPELNIFQRCVYNFIAIDQTGISPASLAYIQASVSK